MKFSLRFALPGRSAAGTAVRTEEAPAEPQSVEHSAADDAALKEFLLNNFLIEEGPAEDTSAHDIVAIGPPAEVPPTEVIPTSVEAVAEEQEKDKEDPPEQVPQEIMPQIPENFLREDPAEAASDAVAEPEDHPEIEHAHTESTDWALEETLASHKEWVESEGDTGKKADLAGKQLEGAELVGVNLRYADLQDANLKAADLLLADLRDACLVRTNLEEACLVGVNLEGANLEDATLGSAMGLVPRQLAGANLRDATVPDQIKEFPAQVEFAAASQLALRFFSATMSLSLLSLLMVWKTKDVQLVTNSAVLPFLHSAAASAALPTAEFYLITPALLLGVYLVFQYHLQRLWDAVLELPATFPDGETLGAKGPWIVRGLLRVHFRWMNQDAPSTRFIEKGISILLAYWIVPATLFLLWGRYLTLQEMHGTLLHELFLVAATGTAIYATTKIGRPQQVWTRQESHLKRFARKLAMLTPTSATAGLGVLFTVLSLGIILGVPHDQSRAPQFSADDIRRWVPSLFWAVGYDPYADLTEASISIRPANWTGADEEVASVKGAHLNQTNFRYAQAYGMFLVNAHLWRSNFQGAFLSEADMRGADLGQANLQSAGMDRVQMSHANLDRATLDGANLSRADLRGANLSYSSLVNATLVDARLDGASLYAGRLSGATLIRASLEKADLRDAHVEGANLEHADLQEAYFWSAKLSGAHLENAQLASAIFIDADLHAADLHGAHFHGTVLNGANLEDTNLDGADLRGSLGLTATQVCSARTRRAATLDDALQVEVDAQCGEVHAAAVGPSPQR